MRGVIRNRGKVLSLPCNKACLLQVRTPRQSSQRPQSPITCGGTWRPGGLRSPLCPVEEEVPPKNRHECMGGPFGPGNFECSPCPRERERGREREREAILAQGHEWFKVLLGSLCPYSLFFLLLLLAAEPGALGRLHPSLV